MGTDDTAGAAGDGAGGNAADGAVGDGTNDSSGTNGNTSTDGSASTDGTGGTGGTGAAMRKKRDQPSNDISKLFHMLLQIAIANFHRSYLVYSRASAA